jgi:tetratricopeptide (TPR) repeat protein
MSRYFKAFIILSFMHGCLVPLAGYASDIEPKNAVEPARVEPVEGLETAAGVKNIPINEETEKILLDAVQNDLPGKEKALFILGRLYSEAGDIEKAENYLIRSIEAYPLLKDYALKLLTGLYLDSGKYEEAVQAARRINSALLLRYAGQSEITALLALKRQDEAGEALLRYI